MKTVEEIRAWVEKQIGEPVTGETGAETTPRWDSLLMMDLGLMIEPGRRPLRDEEFAALTSWRAALALMETPFRKVLVLDADGTLWDGVAGEDEFIAIRTDRTQRWKALRDRGVLLALATRNSQAAVIIPPGMGLVAVEFDCTDKAEALRRIARKLNVGVDALVFVDDSPFEREAVASQLGIPVLAPDDDAEPYFPVMVDTDKTRQYHALAQARKERELYATEEEFLASLQGVVTIALNRRDDIPRIAELCQKSNQFNLTVKRYTEQDILDRMESGPAVWSIRYSDRLGDQGLIGVLIVHRGAVDVFLLSCRILGRGVEWAVWAPYRNEELRASYSPTGRNAQVADFWDRLGLAQGGEKAWAGRPTHPTPAWLTVVYE